MSRAPRLSASARAALVLLAGAFALFGLTAAFAGSLPPVATAPFDFYVMTLSWSPGFCDLGGEDKSPDQCATGAGNGFVVHGLWPDESYGPNPEECNPDQDASAADLATARGLYPTEGLARYEYRKHGTCTGLSAEDYFAAVRYVRDQLKIPPMLQGPREWRRVLASGDRAGLHRGERESHSREHGGDLRARRTGRRALLPVEGPQGLRRLPEGRGPHMPPIVDRCRAGAMRAGGFVNSLRTAN